MLVNFRTLYCDKIYVIFIYKFYLIRNSKEIVCVNKIDENDK